MLIGLYLCFDFKKRTEKISEKKQAGIILVATIIALTLGSINNVLLQELKIHIIPPVANVIVLIWAMGLVLAITKYGLMTITPAAAAEDILATMNDSLILVGPDAKILTVNLATEELLGYKREELIGQPVGKIFAPEEATPFRATRMKRLLEEGSIRDYDMTYRTKSGERIPVSFSGSVMQDKEGELVGIVGIARDMRELNKLMQKEKEFAAQSAAAAAERKRAAELEAAYRELRETQAQLMQSAKMSTIGQLGAGVAHELNNPLAGILGYAQFMLQKLSRPDFAAKDFKTCKRYVGFIEKESERCKAIVENLLSFSRRPKAAPEPLDIKEAIEGTLSIIRHQLELQNIKLTTDYETELPRIPGNVNQLQQVFTNIILNAQHAMPEGGELNIRVGTRMEGGRKDLVVSFKDTGCGIPKENLEKVFEPFFTTKRDWKSVGIGLSITYQIIQNHKGTITVESEEGIGTTFTITLPAS